VAGLIYVSDTNDFCLRFLNLGLRYLWKEINVGNVSVLVLKTPQCKYFFLYNFAFLYIKFLFIDLLY